MSRKTSSLRHFRAEVFGARASWWSFVARRLNAKVAKVVLQLLAPALFTLGVLACRVETSAHSTTAESFRPNVVLIVVDTLRADYLGNYGFSKDTSPSLDALAAEGVVFERAIAASSRTAPSHASIMTSRFARENSIGFENGTTALEGLPTLAGILRDAGYATGAFIGNMLLHSRSGLNQGFDVYDENLPEQEKNRGFFFERRAEQTTERALSWLDELDAEPFFLWLHLQDPHGPYTPPSAFVDQVKFERDPDEAELKVVHGTDGQGGIPAYQYITGSNRPSEYRERYAGEIRYADDWIGKLIEAVDRKAGNRDSIILFTADHGEAMGESGRHFVHGLTCTPEVARVPLILRAPGLTPARRDELVHHVDITPTLLDLVGLPIPDGSSGQALGPVVSGEAKLAERLVYCDVGNEIGVYRQDQTFYRLIGARALEFPVPNGETRLDPLWTRYDWARDGTWTLLDDRVPERDEIRAYYENATENAIARPFDAQEIDRLRALGYVE